MGSRRLVLQGALLLLLIVAALPAALGPRLSPGTAVMRAAIPSPTPSPSATLPPVEAPPDRPAPLTPDMAVGQMMAASFGGPALPPGLRRLILDEKVGTVRIFRDNFTDAPGLARLTAQLQARGREAGLPAPLLVAVDEEGGRVMRVTDGVASLPSELELGRRGPQGVRDAVAATASGLHALGIQLDLAPVADLRLNPADAVIGDRSFGGDPNLVGPLVVAAVNGLHDGGVAATLKHFPGLGGAAGDPHAAMPTDGESLNQWLATPAPPVKAGIQAGAGAAMAPAAVRPAPPPARHPPPL